MYRSKNGNFDKTTNFDKKAKFSFKNETSINQLSNFWLYLIAIFDQNSGLLKVCFWKLRFLAKRLNLNFIQNIDIWDNFQLQIFGQIYIGQKSFL